MTTSTPRPVAVPLYVGGAALSLFGNSAISIVLPWLVISTTGDLSSAGVVAAASGIAAVPATFLAGQLVDRLGARRVAVVADLGSATAVASLAVVDWLWGLDLVWFIALGVAGAVFDVPGMGARQALLAGVAQVSGVRTDRVAAIYQGAFSLAFLAGPALAGVLLAWWDPVDVVWFTAACSAGAALLTRLVPVAAAPPIAAEDAGLSGLGVLLRSRALVAAVVIGFASAFVFSPLLAVVLPGHFTRLDAPGLLGASMSAYAVGSLVGAAGYALVTRRSRRLAYVLGLVVMSAGAWLVAPLGAGGFVMAGMAAMGLGGGLFGPVWNVYIAESVPAHVRGRALSWLNATSLVAGPLGLGALALLLDGTGDLGLAAVLVAATWTLAATWAVLSRGGRELSGPAPAVPADQPGLERDSW
ncbi:MFS transporter [Nocardioides sp. ChNu-153]|uniref:MFS transporter n=1 Tax=unclassified Nocardioides TaxID=2615069 RepID=UPI002405F482|nr:MULTISPECIES: MFS transporter [unclassified Nocardioides]MDF9716713.1 MFS transporter [Nocardioides sp. ChNu-99]MDN7121138.1 MFS transporter [Nocardioides sp. ChNu-153]